MKSPKDALSRREFARRAALGSAAMVFPGPVSAVPVGLEVEAKKLSPQSQAEAEARYRTIFALYPDRFSEAQKTELKRLCQTIQEMLDALRAYSISNSDQPALYLKPLVEREQKSGPPNQKLPPVSSGKRGSDSAKPSAAGKP